MLNNELYNQLKQQGLVLSQGTEISLPSIQSPKPSLLSSLTSYLVPQQNFGDLPHTLIIKPILHNYFIIGRCNTLICYKYDISKQANQIPVINKPFFTHLNYKIDKIHICDAKFLLDRGEVTLIVEAKNQLTIFYVDMKENRFVEGNVMAFHKLESVRFVCEKEVVIVSTSSNHKHFLHHCFVQGGKIKERSKMNLELEKDMEKIQVLQKIDIAGDIDEEQESTICLFYLSILQDNEEKRKRMEQQMFAVQENSQVFRVKEFERDLNGDLKAKNTYKILSTRDHNALPDNYEVVSYDNFYCIVGTQEIIITKKKFERYLFIDNVIEKVGGNSLKFHSRGIVTSQNGLSMELNILQFADPKCHNRMLDNIQIQPELAEGFLMVWPYKVDKETSLMFVFRKDKKLVFCNLIRMNPIDKMLFVVENTPKDKIPMIQQIAVNLGISKKDFYMSQWLHSKRQLPQIHQFLLQCGDIATIKKQLRSTLRKKKLQVGKFQQILCSLSSIINSQLEENLSQHLLIEYIKNDFLLRKIKLKHADWRLDYRELDRIYNSSLTDMFVDIVKNDLYPEKEKLDPLHAMVEAPIKEKMELKHVFQVFRIPILQNYTKFLIKFVSQFTAQQIVKVFEKYYELLPTYEFNPDLIMISPEYETEVELKEKLKQKLRERPNTQEQQFSNITSIEFWREMSKQRMEKQLHDFYPTSKITEAINTLCTSDFGTQLKLHKHGLITCTMHEYRQKLKDISGIKLYLKLCQQVNEYNLAETDPQLDLSRHLIEIFKKNNNLTGKAYETVRLYSSLHRFMLQHSFFEKKRMSTDELVALKSEDLVALFFLENKQRKEFIFEQFRDIFVGLYGGPKEFNEVIDRFITSENCSRIELEIFIHEIKAKPKTFQDQNQDLIQIVIDGFCKKLQLREQNDTQRFIDIMSEMPLIKRLNLKIRKMLSIRQCLNVFVLFNCEKESYFNILHYQQHNHIFRLLLQRYFQGEMKASSIRIDEDQVSLQYCRNMLTVLFYLQEYVYYNVSEYQLLLTYCEVLVEWKQYEVVCGVVHEERVLEQFRIGVVGFIDDLVTTCLGKIYTDEEVEFTQETKEHVRKILQIYGEGQNDVKTRELAKLELAEIFEQWGTNVHTHDIHLVVTQWDTSSRQVFIKDLINSYISHLNFQTFIFLYEHLQLASSQLSASQLTIPAHKEEFIGFSLYYAERLLLEKQFEEIVKILAFVKGEAGVMVSYSLVSETFLKCLKGRCSADDAIENGKEAIEYFTQYFDDDQQVKKIFETDLNAAHFAYASLQKIERIVVDPVYTFRREYVELSVEMLWQIAHSLYLQKGKNIELLYYSYYFLLMIFRYPDHGFKNNKISYSLESLAQLMFRLQAKIDQNSQLWHINIYSLFKKFLRSLYLQGLTRIKQVNPQIFHSQFTQRADESHLQMIKGRLKDDRENNLELLKCISRVENYIGQYKAVRKMERETKLERLVMDQEREKEEKDRQERVRLQLQKQLAGRNPSDQCEQKFTISLRKFNYLRSNISFQSSMSVLITEKEIAEQIYALQKEEKKKTEREIGEQKEGNFFKKLNEHEKQNLLEARSSIEGTLVWPGSGQEGGQMNFMQALQQGMQNRFQPMMQGGGMMGQHQQQYQQQLMMQQQQLMLQQSQHPIPYYQPMLPTPINPFNFLSSPPPALQYNPHQAHQQLLLSILSQIHQQSWPLLRTTYRRQDLAMACERIFYTPTTTFPHCLRLMSNLSIIDQRKLSICISSGMYLENHPYLAIGDEQLKRIFPFAYLVAVSTHYQYEFTQRLYRMMVEAVVPVLDTKTTFFVIEFANYVGSVLGEESYTGHFLVDALVQLVRGQLEAESMSRIALIFNHLFDFPNQVKYHADEIRAAFDANPSNQKALEEYRLQFSNILSILDRSMSSDANRRPQQQMILNTSGYSQSN